ncbi:MAG: hypothetical protein BWX84_01438 [Verrucomicrobia bacterium ADurb.Bin118]|nr:MAG: hypothetical protein BWX84_01438 [Verrucomicrobia bacterium ADurb.Bin118]
MAAVIAADVHIKAVVFRVKLRAAQMPFANARGDVSGLPESVPQGAFLPRQVHGPIRHAQPGVRPHMALDPIRDVQPRGIFAGQERRARGGTDGAGGVGLGEAHALPRQLINMRGGIKGGSLAAQVRPSEIIHKNKDEIQTGPGLDRNPPKEPQHRQQPPPPRRLSPSGGAVLRGRGAGGDDPAPQGRRGRALDQRFNCRGWRVPRC